jgi:hypothetical protein
MNKTNIEIDNSKQKQIQSTDRKMRIEELSTVIEDLNMLCNDLDPYLPLSEDQLKQLSAYGIFKDDDPFLITNKLVLILENSVEELISLGGTP